MMLPVTPEMLRAERGMMYWTMLWYVVVLVLYIMVIGLCRFIGLYPKSTLPISTMLVVAMGERIACCWRDT